MDAPRIAIRMTSTPPSAVGVSGDPADPSTARGFLLAKGAKGPFTTISRPGAPRVEGFRARIVGVGVERDVALSRIVEP